MDRFNGLNIWIWRISLQSPIIESHSSRPNARKTCLHLTCSIFCARLRCKPYLALILQHRIHGCESQIAFFFKNTNIYCLSQCCASKCPTVFWSLHCLHAASNLCCSHSGLCPSGEAKIDIFICQRDLKKKDLFFIQTINAMNWNKYTKFGQKGFVLFVWPNWRWCWPINFCLQGSLSGFFQGTSESLRLLRLGDVRSIGILSTRELKGHKCGGTGRLRGIKAHVNGSPRRSWKPAKWDKGNLIGTFGGQMSHRSVLQRLTCSCTGQRARLFCGPGEERKTSLESLVAALRPTVGEH